MDYLEIMKAHFSGPSHLSWNHVLTSCGALCSRSARITGSARGCGNLRGILTRFIVHPTPILQICASNNEIPTLQVELDKIPI